MKAATLCEFAIGASEPTSAQGFRACFIFVSLALLVPPLFAQDVDQDTLPGLVARYRAGAKSLVRIDSEVAFDWKSDSPDPRLPLGPFAAHWTGLLLIREETPYRFHAFVQGKVAVTVDGRAVLAGERDRAGWISGNPTALGFGERAIDVTFDAAAKGATLKLFWSSDRFPIEPLPAHLLFYDAASLPERGQIAQIETGRREFEAHRCGRCHRREQSFLLSAPSLVHVAVSLNRRSLIAKIGRRQSRPDGESMPTFEFTDEEATAIASFLRHNSQPAALEAGPTIRNPEKEARQGGIRVRSLGCLACHSIPDRLASRTSPSEARNGSRQTVLGNSGPYSGGDLSFVGSRRSADWLWTWLAKPEAINADHRMPVFRLKDKERRQIVAYLMTLKLKPDGHSDGTNTDADDDALVEHGRSLTVKARCAACHEISGLKSDVASIPDLSLPVKDWKNACLSPQTDRDRFRPGYSELDEKAVRAFVDSHSGPMTSEAMVLRGARLLERKNCIVCHPRGNQPGLGALAARLSRENDSQIGGAAALVPPNLTAVGDKLKDQALAEAVRGDAKKRRLPWLSVRMPRFRHSAEEQASLTATLISHDRIPDAPPQSTAKAASIVTSQDAAEPHAEDRITVGQSLIGVKGFSCIACHEMGKYVPKNVALPTHGSDLLGLGRRMRREYFFRWTRSPLRIRPGMEMPSYERPVAGLLNNNVERQLDFLWDVLNDPGFTPPTFPAAVEQFLVVKPGSPARILRDVFASRPGNGAAVARAFAVGFNNSHSVLFDLDSFCVRDWTVGDFAQQRTSGKSWNWDLAGQPVVRNFDAVPEISLARINGTGPPVIPTPMPESGSPGRLEHYSRFGDGVQLSYSLRFEVEHKARTLRISETWTPLSATNANSTGFRRHIKVTDPIDGYQAFVSVPFAKDLPVGVTIGTSGSNEGGRLGIGGSPSEIVLEYRCAQVGHRSVFEPGAVAKIVPETIDSVPGFDGIRLPLSRSIMPTALAWTSEGNLAFTSLKGHVYVAHDTDNDGIEDRLDVFEEGLAAPYGLIADGHDLFVAHKPELLRLRDLDGNGRADERKVIATGWGYTENYHDWTCGIVRDRQGGFYVGLGSDYSQKVRARDHSRWRGSVLRIMASGEITEIARGLRYPTGLALDDHGRLFVTDNQGDQNPFNEINHIIENRHYGVASRHETNRDAIATPPAIELPHPWTRSVNGICFLPGAKPYQLLAGHGIGCEYNGRFLIRFTLQEVDGIVQGAAYPFSTPPNEKGRKDGQSIVLGGHHFVGPLCCAVSPQGALYVGGIQDSGWLGGTNVGEIVRLRPNGRMSNGIREIRVVPDGFEITFLAAVEKGLAERPTSFTISGYTRIWQGDYATPDSGRHRIAIRACDVSPDGKTVLLHTDQLRPGHVYEVNCSAIGAGHQRIWPATGYYTLHRIPKNLPASNANAGR